MRQQVNLFQPADTAVSQALSSTTAMIASVVIVAAFVALWGFGRWELSKLSAGVDDVLKQQQAQQDMLAAAALQQQQLTPEELQAQVAKIEADLNVRTRALAMLRAGAVGEKTGFAARFEALARSHVEGIWLDHVMLAGSGNAMSLSGATLDANLIPRYLQNLAADPVLSGTRFDEFVIEEPVADEEADDKHKAPTRASLRFRAGNKSLTPPQTEGAS